MAKAELKPNEVKETRITEQVRPARVEEGGADKWWHTFTPFKESQERPEFWEFLEFVPAEEWVKTVARVWRYDPNARNNLGIFVNEFRSGPITPESLREAIGGGKFKVYLRRGESLIYNEVVELSGPVKSADAVANAAAAPTSNDALTKLIELLERRLANPAEDLTTRAMHNALDMQTKGYELLMAKAVNQQPQTSLQQLLEQAQLLRSLGGLGAAPTNTLGTVKELAEVITVAVGAFKSLGFSTPTPPAGSDWGAIGAALVNQLPVILDKTKETIREARGPGERVINAEVIHAGSESAQPSHSPIPPAQIPSIASGKMAIELPTEIVEAKLVEMLTAGWERAQTGEWKQTHPEPIYSGQDAAAWVKIAAPRLFDQIMPHFRRAAQDPNSRALMFHARPMLAPVLDHPRLQIFLNEIVSYLDAPEEGQGTSPRIVTIAPA